MMLRVLTVLLALGLPASAEQSPLPLDVGGAFTLTDQTGQTRTQIDPDGRHQILFFGYGNCQQICSAILPMMAEVTDQLKTDGMAVRPVMITVDPARDTVETLAPLMDQHHPDFLGLTGSEDALQVAYDAFQVEKEEIFTDPEFGPVYAHGSFIYLLDPEGEFLTLFPPTLPPEAATRIVAKYLGQAS